MVGRAAQIGLALAVVGASSAAAVGLTSATSSDPASETRENGTPAHAVEHKDAVEAYRTAVREWTGCVREHASARREEPSGERGPFDPRAACGDHPSPHDFGMTGRPDNPGKPEEAGRPEDAGKPDDVPRGRSTPPTP